MSGPAPNFNPGAYEFRPGHGQPFVPQGQQQGQQGQQQQQGAYDPYGQQQGGYGGYNSYGQQQGGYEQYGQPQQQYGGGYGGGYGGYGAPPPAANPIPTPRNANALPTIDPNAPKKPITLGLSGAGGKSLSLGGAGKSISIGGGGGGKSISIGGAGGGKSISIGGAKAADKSAPSSEKPAQPAQVTALSTPASGSGAVSTTATAGSSPAPSAPASPKPEAKAAVAAAKLDEEEEEKQAEEALKKEEKKIQEADDIAKEQEKVADQAALDQLYDADAKVDPNAKLNLNIVFTGHVDAGKSTMGGQLLYLCGEVDKRTLEKYEQEAKAAGRETWYLSWALDSTTQERAKGKTVEVGRATFSTDRRQYTILDAPGHKTFVPSMIQGAAQADIALLVISARKGEFETGFEKDGQTREHAFLLKSNGVNKLVVVINKMDDVTVKWDKGRYDEIIGKLKPYLKSVGFNPKTDLAFIPVSAQVGENMKERVKKETAPWYDGPSLLEFLDEMPLEDRNINGPFMLPISEKYNELGTIAVGKIESGRVKKGDHLLLMPNKVDVEVSGVFTEQSEEMEQAYHGDNIRIRLKGVTDDEVLPGYVLTSLQKPIKAVTRFEAQIHIIDTKNIICSGYSAVLHVHTLAEEVTLTKLLAYYDKSKPPRRSKKPPQYAKVGQMVLALIETSAPICIEKWDSYKMLGRFTLRDEGKTVAIGKVTKLIESTDEMPDVAGISLTSSNGPGMHPLIFDGGACRKDALVGERGFTVPEPETLIYALIRRKLTTFGSFDNMSEFFISDSSPLIAYSSRDGRQDWRSMYAMQGDNFDQSLHSTVVSQAFFSFNVAATRLSIQVPSFTDCSATISINETTPVAACSSPSTLFTLDGLPAGLHRVTYGVGNVSHLVDSGDDLVFWGLAGFGPKRPDDVRNITIDNTFSSRPQSSDGSIHPIELSFTSEWQQVSEATSGTAQVSLSKEIIQSAFNQSLALTDKKDSQMTLKGHGSAIYLYGSTGPDFGSAAVILNGVTVASARAWASGYDLLWFQDGLDVKTESTMVLTNLENRRLAVDFLMLTADGVQVDALVTSSSSGGFMSKPAGKAIVFGVLPLVICAIGGLLALCLIRKRRARRPRISIPSQEDEKSRRDSTQSFSDQHSGSVFYSYNTSDNHRRESTQTNGSERSRSELLSPADSYKMATLNQEPFRQRSGGHSLDSDVSPATDRTYQLPYERTAFQRSSAGSDPYTRPSAPTLGGSHTTSASIDGRLDTLASLTGTGRGSLVRIIQEAVALGGAISPRSTVPPAYSSGVSPVEAAAAREKFSEEGGTEAVSGPGPSAWSSPARDNASSIHSAISGRRAARAPSIISMMGGPPSLARMSTASSGTGMNWEDFNGSDMPPVPTRALAVNTTKLRPMSANSATPESLLEPRSTTTSDHHRKTDWPVPPPVPSLSRSHTGQVRVQSDALSINASLSGAARPDSELYNYDSPIGSLGNSPLASTSSPSGGRMLQHRASSSFSGSQMGFSPSPSRSRRLSIGSFSQMPAAQLGAGLRTPTLVSDNVSITSPDGETLSPSRIRAALRMPSSFTRDSDYRGESEYRGSEYSAGSANAPPINMSALSQRKLENPAAFRFSGVMPVVAQDARAQQAISSKHAQGKVKAWKEVVRRKVAPTADAADGDGSFLSLGASQGNRF